MTTWHGVDIDMQKKVFLDGEADAWYRRNSARIIDCDRHVSDPILTEFERFDISARNVLEIGCSNGWRLNALKNSLVTKICG